jgi:hypothetical protein
MNKKYKVYKVVYIYSYEIQITIFGCHIGLGGPNIILILGIFLRVFATLEKIEELFFSSSAYY